MGASRSAIVLAVLLIGAPARAADALLFLGSPEHDEAEERAVVEAAIIYTRDLGVTIRVLPRAPPAAVSPESVAEVAAVARAGGARLVFWYAPRTRGVTAAGVVLYTVGRDGVHETHALVVPGPATPELHRALGLKLRAVLTGAARAEPSVPMPRPSVAPGAGPLRPGTPSAAAAPTSAPASPTTGPPGTPPAKSRRLRMRLATSYWLTVPASGTLLRQGLAVEAAAQPHPLVEAHLGLDLTTRPAVTGASGVATLLDLPIRAGARLLLRRGRWALGLGPVVSLHVLSATGLATDGTAGSSTQATAGLGAVAVARLEVWSHMSLDVRLLLERTLPHTRFLLNGAPAIDDGTLLVGVGVGVSFVAP
ncbi:MAG: hypothetical protein HY906_24355 [Deltaproteobacteria bacterium]|nr:hypothetical protein [Deltaproteobacteria bacterium]